MEIKSDLEVISDETIIEVKEHVKNADFSEISTLETNVLENVYFDIERGTNITMEIYDTSGSILMRINNLGKKCLFNFFQPICM